MYVYVKSGSYPCIPHLRPWDSLYQRGNSILNGKWLLVCFGPLPSRIQVAHWRKNPCQILLLYYTHTHTHTHTHQCVYSQSCPHACWVQFHCKLVTAACWHSGLTDESITEPIQLYFGLAFGGLHHECVCHGPGDSGRMETWEKPKKGRGKTPKSKIVSETSS